MPKAIVQEAFTTFIGGLNTEAGELTFPKGASVDELNCLLERDGSRRRRLGASYESAFELTTETYSEGTYTKALVWENVGGSGGRQFVVVQVGGTIRFFSNSSAPLSDQVVFEDSIGSTTPYIVDLATYAVGSSVTDPIEVTSINGALVVVSPAIEAFFIEYDETDGTFTETQIPFRVRDFEWMGDTSTYFEGVALGSVTVGRTYDTKNAGWDGGIDNIGTDALITYIGGTGEYPPLTHPWYSGKNSSGDFNVGEFEEIYAGTSRVANGHYIYSLFNIDRETESGVVGVEGYVDSSRFKTITAYAGRVFYSGLASSKNSSKIYFSQLLQDFNQIGECLQLNDPTAEYLSDLLDTDGGVISIPEAHNIKKLHVFGPKLLVFAENGVWAVSGVDDVFRATEFSISKISEVGIDSVGSFVSGGGRPYWWSFQGVHTVVVTDQGGFREQNISLDTIQTFWVSITPTQRDTMAAAYDGVNNKVFWFYPSEGETVENKYNNVLVFDETLSAFYPWAIEDKDTDTPQIVGVFYLRNAGQGLISHNVVDSSGNLVIDSAGDQVVAFAEGRTDTGVSDVKLLLRDSSGSITFGDFSDTDFLDWGTEDYSSFAESGFNFQGDMTSFKTTPYVTVYLKRTEEGWTGTDETGYNPIRPSSLMLEGFIDFNSAASSSPQQAYRYKFPLVVDSGDLTDFDYPSSVIATRLKVRGRGRSYRLKFSSETGKDFHLLGWEVIGGKNTNV